MMRALAGSALFALAFSCGGPHDLAPPTAEQLLKTRPYTLRVPASLPPGPAPLVLGLHGFGADSASFEAWWQLGPAAAASGVLYAALNGQPDRNGNQRWNAVPKNALAPYDIQYLAAVIDDVARQNAVDPKRVYVVGSSLGGFMSYRAACELSPRFAAIVSLSGQGAVADSLCPATSQVSVLEVHGDRDSQIAYDGSGGPSSRDVVESWGGRNGCSGRLTSTTTTLDIEADIAGAETVVARVAGCPPGVAAELWTIQGGEHHPNLIVPAWGDAVISWLLLHPKP